MNTRSNGGITLVTPLMKWWAVIWLRIQFVVTRIWPKFLGLQVFNSVYVTHWCIVKRLPAHVGGARKTRLKHKWLLWEVSYSAAVDPYIEQFAKGIPKNINRVWGTSDGFPGTRSVSQLSDYIMKLSFEIGHMYWANAQATLRTVQSGFTVCREHAGLVARAQAGDAVAFKKAYDAFLARPPEPTVWRRRGPKTIVVLTAIKRDEEAALTEVIASLDPADSPFAAIPSVHMARLVVVGRFEPLAGMEQPQELPGRYLLLSVAAHGDADAFFQRLCSDLSGVAHQIWGHCVGYPDHDDGALRRYLTDHRLRVAERAWGFDDATPAKVAEVVALRDEHADFAMTAQSLDPAPLLAAFRARFV